MVIRVGEYRLRLFTGSPRRRGYEAGLMLLALMSGALVLMTVEVLARGFGG